MFSFSLEMIAMAAFQCSCKEKKGDIPVDRIRISFFTRFKRPNVFTFKYVFNAFPRKSLHCKLDPAQYREYEYVLLIVKKDNAMEFVNAININCSNFSKAFEHKGAL